MEINKQLFEDVLSGKLKGVFVLRNGRKVKSSELSIDTSDITDYHVCLNRNWYTYQGEFDLVRKNHPVDIIDFIPDTDMKQNELKIVSSNIVYHIEIPNNKVVDWEESKKQNKIVFKDKQLTYEDICKELFQPNGCYYICGNGEIISSLGADRFSSDANNATTKHQLECILAKNKLANVAKYLNNGWKPSYTSEGHYNAWVLFTTPNKDYIGYVKIGNCGFNSNVLFKTKEFAQQAIEILGEETVKLALEPLGI